MTQEIEVATETPTSSPASSAAGTAGNDPFARLGDIEVQATVEVGTAELLVRDLAALAPGFVIELDRLVGEPADLKVNGRLFARGEVVVVEDQLGFRITQLVAKETGHP